MHESSKELRTVALGTLGERLSALRVREPASLEAVRRSLAQHGQLSALVVFSSGGHLRSGWLKDIRPELKGAVRRYWADEGKDLAAYRNLDQHFTVLATGAWLRLEHGTISGIRIGLPDNPDERSQAKLTYNDQHSATARLSKWYEGIHDLVEATAELFVPGQRKPVDDTVTWMPIILHRGTAGPTAVWVLEGTSVVVMGETANGRVTLQEGTIEYIAPSDEVPALSHGGS